MRCNNWVLKDTYPQHEGCFHKINSGSHSIYKPAWSCIICSISNNAEDIPLRNEIFLNCGSDSITFKLKPTHNLTTYSLTLVHHSISLAIKSDPKYRLTIPCNWIIPIWPMPCFQHFTSGKMFLWSHSHLTFKLCEQNIHTPFKSQWKCFFNVELVQNSYNLYSENQLNSVL